MKSLRHIKDCLLLSGMALAIAALVMTAAYIGVSWAAFQWRNPKANRMSFFREFPEVMMWEKMSKYQ